MTDWDRIAMDSMVAGVVAAQAASAYRVIADRHPYRMSLQGDTIVIGEDGLVAEYGTPDKSGTPWIMDALGSVNHVVDR